MKKRLLDVLLAGLFVAWISACFLAGYIVAMTLGDKGIIPVEADPVSGIVVDRFYHPETWKMTLRGTERILVRSEKRYTIVLLDSLGREFNVEVDAEDFSRRYLGERYTIR